MIGSWHPIRWSAMDFKGPAVGETSTEGSTIYLKTLSAIKIPLIED